MLNSRGPQYSPARNAHHDSDEGTFQLPFKLRGGVLGTSWNALVSQVQCFCLRHVSTSRKASPGFVRQNFDTMPQRATKKCSQWSTSLSSVMGSDAEPSWRLFLSNVVRTPVREHTKFQLLTALRPQ